MAPRERRRYRGIIGRKTRKPSWSAAITVNKVKYHHGTWGDQETAARAYDWMAMMHLEDSAMLNFPEYRAFAQERAPRDIRFVTMAKEREHRQADTTREMDFTGAPK